MEDEKLTMIVIGLFIGLILVMTHFMAYNQGKQSMCIESGNNWFVQGGCDLTIQQNRFYRALHEGQEHFTKFENGSLWDCWESKENKITVCEKRDPWWDDAWPSLLEHSDEKVKQ